MQGLCVNQFLYTKVSSLSILGLSVYLYNSITGLPEKKVYRLPLCLPGKILMKNGFDFCQDDQLY